MHWRQDQPWIPRASSAHSTSPFHYITFLYSTNSLTPTHPPLHPSNLTFNFPLPLHLFTCLSSFPFCSPRCLSSGLGYKTRQCLEAACSHLIGDTMWREGVYQWVYQYISERGKVFCSLTGQDNHVVSISQGRKTPASQRGRKRDRDCVQVWWYVCLFVCRIIWTSGRNSRRSFHLKKHQKGDTHHLRLFC